jgi:hypothetical protein
MITVAIVFFFFLFRCANDQGAHDRWQGFEPEMYKKVMLEFEEADHVRRKKVAEDRAKQSLAAEQGEADPVEDSMREME